MNVALPTVITVKFKKKHSFTWKRPTGITGCKTKTNKKLDYLGFSLTFLAVPTNRNSRFLARR